MNQEDREALEREGLDPDALQRMVNATGTAWVIQITPEYGKAIAEVAPTDEREET